MKTKTESALDYLQGLFETKYPGQTEMAQKAMELYRQAMEREKSPTFEDQVTMVGQTAALRNLMVKHQDIYTQIKSL